MPAKNQRELAEKRFGTLSIPQLTEVQAAWLAALVDGEGTIGIWRSRRSDGGAVWHYTGVMQVSNTCAELLAHASNILEGCCWKITVRNTKNVKLKHHKPLYRLDLSRRAVPYIVEQILPFLIVKKEQAKLLLKYYHVVHNAPLSTSEDHEMFEHFYLEMRALNARGSP